MHIDAPFQVDFVHRLRCTTHAIHPSNHTLVDLLESDNGPAQALCFVDAGLCEAWPRLPAQIDAYVAAHHDRIELAGPTRFVPGGERCKTDRSVIEPVFRAIFDAALCRRSYVIVIGGGAVLDAVGFAAGLTHRGLRIVRLPTTTLSQADSGVGIKCGINAFNTKNFLGLFQPPWAVINDEAFLRTLAQRDWRAGFSEVVKVALLKDADLFAQIERCAAAVATRDADAASPLLRRAAELHLRHITLGGDPFEFTTARPLDFGHWAAHRLEEMSGFRLRHGEAVAIGLAIDTLYATRAGWLDERLTQRIHHTLRTLGFSLNHPALNDTDALLRGIESFRQHLGGRLTLTMIRDIAQPFDVHQLDLALLEQVITDLARSPAPAAPADPPPQPSRSGAPS